jgi:hypothetical protein
MNRRGLLGALGTSATSGLVLARSEVIAQEGRAHERGHHDELHQKCADACASCMHECEDGFHYCYRQVSAGKTGHAKAMHLCVDCAEICGTSAKLVARMSPLMTHTCQACAASCDDCVAECEKLHDPEMRLVVESLRACAQSCREMVKAMGGHQHHEGRTSDR